MPLHTSGKSAHANHVSSNRESGRSASTQQAGSSQASAREHDRELTGVRGNIRIRPKSSVAREDFYLVSETSILEFVDLLASRVGFSEF